MKILAVGGGSGGHVTPVVAVLRELKKHQPEAEIRFWCDKKFYTQAKSIVHHFDSSMPVDKVIAGKLRRYHSLPLWRQVTQPTRILLPNLRDLFLVGGGVIQSFFKLLMWRPDVVFTKGGFVCLPVGMAAWVLRIPLVIHDSDAHPGLTNRILARWATKIATGAPLEYYHYPKNKARYIGIPIAGEFTPFSVEAKRKAKQELGFDPDRPLVVITGGGLGAKRINDASAQALDTLLPVTSVILISGMAQYDELRAITPQADSRFQLHSFVSSGMATMLGAADIAVARAGATTILELAALATPTILVPNAYLTGGHQLKNAKVYADAKAVVVINEDDMMADAGHLGLAVKSLLAESSDRMRMAKTFHSFSKPSAAKDMAEMILTAVKTR